MNSKILSLLSVSAIALSACTAAVPSDDDTDHSSHSSVVSAPFIDNEESSSSSATTASSVTSSVQADGTRVIQLHMKNWEFSPAAISVKKGEKVQLQLIGDEGIHGFAVPGLNLNVRVEAGQTVTVDLDTSVAGTFEGFCSIPCGPGHRDMKATITVTE